MTGEELIEAHIRAWNGQDIDQLLELMTPNCLHFDAYFADLVPVWNIREYLKIDMESANVRYTVTDVVQCDAEALAYNYSAEILDDNDCIVTTFPATQRLRLDAGKICRTTDLYVAPPELLSLYYDQSIVNIDGTASCDISEFSIDNILGCRRHLVRGVKTEFGFTDSNITLAQFAREIGYVEDMISLVVDCAFKRNFDEFVIKCRIDCARDMIRQQILAGFSSTDLNVDKRIAKKIGFKSHRPFVEAFVNATGMTPRQWRHLHWEEHRKVSKVA